MYFFFHLYLYCVVVKALLQLFAADHRLYHFGAWLYLQHEPYPFIIVAEKRLLC